MIHSGTKQSIATSAQVQARHCEGLAIIRKVAKQSIATQLVIATLNLFQGKQSIAKKRKSKRLLHLVLFTEVQGSQ